MENTYFNEMLEIEDWYFWHKARREIIYSALKTQNLLNMDYSVLEIGASAGINMRYFKKYFKTIKGSEINREAIKTAKEKSPDIDIINGSLPYNIGFGEEQFDLIFLFDVLEHVQDDISALLEIKKRLKNGGGLIITVPAYQFLFGEFDKINYHFRRYNIKHLAQIVQESGFNIQFKSYFSFWLFPIVLISRLIEKLIKKPSKFVIRKNSLPIINNILFFIMRSEKYLLRKNISLPFGSSVLMVCENI